MLKLGDKIAKTNPEKAQLFAESVERNFGTESHLFRKSHFDCINKFVEAHSYHFTPLSSLHSNITDTDDDRNLAADVDPDTLIHIVRTELKNGKAPGIKCVQRHSQEANRYRILQSFGLSIYHISKTRFYSIFLEGSSPFHHEKLQ